MRDDSYHEPEDVCKSPDRWVLRCRYTPAGSTSCRRYTARQSRTGTWESGIYRSSGANSDVRTAADRWILSRPSGRAPLPYGRLHPQKGRSTSCPRQKCNLSTVGSQQSTPARKNYQGQKLEVATSRKGEKTDKYWCKRNERIVDSPRPGHIVRLKRQLKTTTPSPEAQSIHIDVIRQRCSILRLWKRNPSICCRSKRRRED